MIGEEVYLPHESGDFVYGIADDGYPSIAGLEEMVHGVAGLGRMKWR